MAEYTDLQVRTLDALLRERGALSGLTEEVLKELASTQRTLQEIAIHCAAFVRDRSEALRECESMEDSDCSRVRARYDTAIRVQSQVNQVVTDLSRDLRLRCSVITEQSQTATAWLSRVVAHLEGVGPPPEDFIPASGSAVTSARDEIPGPSGQPELPASAASLPGGRSIIAGLELASDVLRVRVNEAPIRSDLFEVEPAKGGTTKEDMIWAAVTFRDVVLPHIARGGTRDELREIDLAEGNSPGLRRLEGAWEVYLGNDIPRVTLDATGQIVDIDWGRHRILAAQLAGLSWIPMRVSGLTPI